jgi:cytoskeleton protein RodZ
MDDLGAQLKRARDERGMSLSEIANRTKISVTALEALERNDLSKLPGGIFGRAFVRAYAGELGLDPDKTVADFHVALEEAERRAAERGALRVEITADDREFLERQRRAVRIFRVALAVVAIGAVVLLGWLVRGMWSAPSTPAGGASAPATTSP